MSTLPDPSQQRVDLNKPILSLGDLPQIENLDKIQKLEIWFGTGVFMNSNGARAWLEWLKPVANKNDIKISLEEVPPNMINLMNMILNLVPSNAEVLSFYVPYYSEETAESRSALLRKGYEFTNEKLVLPELFDTNGNLMEADIVKKTYFKFLNLPKIA